MTLLSLIAIALFGGSLALLARGIAFSRTRTSERVRQIDSYGFTASSAIATVPVRDERRTIVAVVAEAVGNRLARRLRSFHPDEVRREIVAAGLYRLTPGVLLGYRALGLVLFGGLGIYAAREMRPASATVVILLGAAIGWLGPLMYVRRRARFRLQVIDRSLPDLIDLLTVTVEAGLGLGASLKVGAERTHGPLGDELRIVMQEQKIGRGLAEALEAMLERADTPAMRSFVRSLSQGESLGVSIGTMMRNLASEMRKRRRMTVEEQANKTPVKILFPLVFLILPSLLIVVLAPALFSLGDNLGG